MGKKRELGTAPERLRPLIYMKKRLFLRHRKRKSRISISTLTGPVFPSSG